MRKRERKRERKRGKRRGWVRDGERRERERVLLDFF